MIKKHFKHICLAITVISATGIHAQTTAERPATGYNIEANIVTDRTVPFSAEAEGKKLPVAWGLDTAWPDEGNMRRGIAFIGKENLSVARGSFQPSDIVSENGTLSDAQKKALDERLKLIGLSGVRNVVLNCDHEVLNRANYVGKPDEWANLIKATARYVQSRGYYVVTVSPFNEPDYTPWGQGSKEDFRNVARLLKEDTYFNNIRVSGGNTLNCDEALAWFNYMGEYIDEGNTHQLAGDFDHYADFFTQVRNSGKYATADELHNVMEAMVGAEYGMQTGIWWGFDGLARGEFCKASAGERLAYSEDRPHWTAAAVYRSPDGKVQAFGGTSERQANNSSYRFVSKDRDVYFDGYGPQREYIMELPGGTGYQKGQTNAERVVNITWGEDVQPAPINGRYVIMNKNSTKVISVMNGATNDGASICQNRYSGKDYQHWDIKPVSTRIGGDFSYFTISSARDGKQLDILNWSLESGANIILYGGDTGANEQWYLEYAGNGDYYIMSRHSNLCLEMVNNSKIESAVVRQAAKNGKEGQKWRLLPVGAECDLDSPRRPSTPEAISHSASIELRWNANTEKDMAGYMILRAEKGSGNTADNLQWNTIGRMIQGTAFTDNTVEQGVTYLYKIKAADRSCNISEPSEETEASTDGTKTMVARLNFENDLTDGTANQFNCAHFKTPAFAEGHNGEYCLNLDGGKDYVQLPYQLGNMNEMTVCTWVKWLGGNPWQRIFDFGNGEDQYMFLTPSNGSVMRLAMKNGDNEQTLDCDRIELNEWTHIAVVLGKENVAIYVNGKKAAESMGIDIRPANFKPVLNYIGRSQYSSDPMLRAHIDDFRVYNYALSPDEVLNSMKDIANGITTVSNSRNSSSEEYYSTAGTRLPNRHKGINIVRKHLPDGTVTVRKIVTK